jgi:hypothetical protein
MLKRVHGEHACTDLGLDVPVANANPVDGTQGPAHLVGVQLYKDIGHALVVLGVVLADPVDRVWHKLQDEVQVRLLLLRVRVKAVLELDNVRVVNHLHYLQLSVLEPLVLQHLLDCHLQQNSCKLDTPELDKRQISPYPICRLTVSPVSRQVAWYTTPKEPLPTTRSVE